MRSEQRTTWSNARAVDLDHLAIEIYTQIVSIDDRLRMSSGASHNGMNARDQLILVERLGHVVVSTEAEAFDLVLDAGEAGEDQNRQRRYPD
jgi:hypothetical protein